MLIRIGYDLTFEFSAPTAMTLLLFVHPERAKDLVAPEKLILEPDLPVQEFTDVFGNRSAKILAPQGLFRLRSESFIRDDGLVDAQNPSAQQHPVADLPADVLQFLMASRYCEVDRLGSIAWDLFGKTEPGWARAKAVCNWCQANIKFGYPFARATKTAWDTYVERTAVCRDFMHLAVTFCRCLNIPARYATGYLGDIGVPISPDPMDFSAFFEVYLDGKWWPMDARHNIPRLGRVLMARGRDATDVALTTSFGPSRLVKFAVVTEEVVDGAVSPVPISDQRKSVLFLCTGNYYRSRFAEILFNHLAQKNGLPWRAESRGLARDFGTWNVGPISPYTLSALTDRQIAHPQPRDPLHCREDDLARASLVVALKEAEHRPMLLSHFPGWENRAEYWHVHDMDQAKADEALREIEQLVENLIAAIEGFMSGASGQLKTALITGASVGIGRDLAVVLAEHGHDLVITARNQSQLESFAAELRSKHSVGVEVVVADLAKPQAAQDIFDEISRQNISIDILINNAGFGGHGRFDGENLDEILGMLQVNIVSLTHLTRLFLPAMIERRRGRVMNVASTAAFQAGPLMAVYYATKAYVLSLSEAIASELKRTGVGVTALCPGPTITEFQKRAGVGTVRAFNMGMMMESMPVAQAGYRAMMAGKRIAITGWRNKLLAQASQLMPRKLVTSVVKHMNSAR